MTYIITVYFHNDNYIDVVETYAVRTDLVPREIFKLFYSVYSNAEQFEFELKSHVSYSPVYYSFVILYYDDKGKTLSVVGYSFDDDRTLLNKLFERCD